MLAFYVLGSSKTNTAAIVVPIVVIVLVAIAAVCGFLYWRKRGFPLRRTVDDDPYDTLDHDKVEQRYNFGDTIICNKK